MVGREFMRLPLLRIFAGATVKKRNAALWRTGPERVEGDIPWGTVRPDTIVPEPGDWNAWRLPSQVRRR